MRCLAVVLTFFAVAASPAVAMEARALAAPMPDMTARPDSAAPIVLASRPAPRDNDVPRARWEHRPSGDLWTRVAIEAVEGHGSALLKSVPRDISEWCPAYPENGPEERAAFWAGLLSTLSRYESTWDPRAVGGGGRWFGLLQIYPPTAEFRDCRVQTGEGLKSGADNLSCAVRIMAVTVPRDAAISLKEGRWKGVAADWGPIRTDWMRRDMQRYTKKQVYCRSLAEVRPRARPSG